MKRWKRIICSFITFLLLAQLIACGKSKSNEVDTSSTPTITEDEPTTTTPEPTITTPEPTVTAPEPTKIKIKFNAKKYDDLRGFNTRKWSYSPEEYVVDDMFTYSFNEDVIFEGNEALKEEIIERGKNPGLGIRKLHEEGITGKGINVAIIDQYVFLHHPEFDGKIVKFYDTGCSTPEDKKSMHGPAVTSLLVGTNIGVAPEANLYYAAIPQNSDAQYFTKGLLWIIDENKLLPDDQKIRVVSVSAAPSGEFTPYTENTEMWEESVALAEAEGILVLDCRPCESTSIADPIFYDPHNPDDISLCNGGYPDFPFVVPDSFIGTPTCYRTVAEEYTDGHPSYYYTSIARLSWATPYISGVLALGWQINPKLGNDEIKDLLIHTGSPGADGSNIINPPAFIEAVKKTLK